MQIEERAGNGGEYGILVEMQVLDYRNGGYSIACVYQREPGFCGRCHMMAHILRVEVIVNEFQMLQSAAQGDLSKVFGGDPPRPSPLGVARVAGYPKGPQGFAVPW